jgi:hypothetical protein
MKKTLALFFTCGIIISSVLIKSCKKDTDSDTKVYTEEFKDVASLFRNGWINKDNSREPVGQWRQGINGVDKAGVPYGFPAFSFEKQDVEYAFAGHQSSPPYSPVYEISSWLITPAYEIKNGDKITFYTRAAPGNVYADRLQVRLNETDNSADVGSTPSSIGKFTMLVKDINDNLNINGYTKVWTKQEIVISGLAAPIQSRIAFRYFPDGSKSNGIGIDQFQFTSY